MSETVDDWVTNPEKSLVPSRKDPARPSHDDLRNELENAPEAVPLEAYGDMGGQGPDFGRDPQDTGAGYDAAVSGGSGSDDRPFGEIYSGCPVKPLGIYGDLSFYLDVRGQLRAVKKHELDTIRHLFGGRIGLLSEKWPQIDAKGFAKSGKFDQNDAAFTMVQACEERGVWSPTGRVRGAGAWVDDDGKLIFHAGDKILIDGEWEAPGVYDGKVYSAADKIPRPAETKGRYEAGQKLLEHLGSWYWRRPDVDPHLMLGVVCAQMLGGALDWRPVTWLSGDQATGKSTLQKLLKNVHGGSDGLLQASDATEAGIRSVIGYSSLPVALDELEPDEDARSNKAKNIIKLARIAASGDQILRGSTDQKGYQGNAYSCFVFSSILVPPLPPQDRSRLILFDLNEIPKEARKLDPDWRAIRNLGGQLRRRLIDGWETWHERLDLWRAALANGGYGGRHADNYGTVLAMADMALSEDLPSEELLAGWVAKIALHLKDDTADIGSNAQDMMTHLMGQQLDVWRGGTRYNVGSWVAMVAKLPGAPQQLGEATPENGNGHLAQYGLRVRGSGASAELAIANQPVNQLGSLFFDSRWAGGVWQQAARRVHGAKAGNLSFARVRSRATWIPLPSIAGMMDMPADRGEPFSHPEGASGDVEGFA
ncbi:DUF927 domain-containing protein [Pacificibacter marinus]|uniref:DUF927 domain-containing protein n=1 Tax=Pacificibacter marinus TaxID=658057 RepID=UPI001C071200|nr:DUF927 domain-containing protein [Pacificibacter marinus]MBU2867026.1 DUF927 domain-containing protein [Pacificibacter marinus]